MTVFDLLKHDHEKVSQLLAQACQTTERAEKTREKLFEEIKNELKVHEQIEEKIFYPVLKEFKETKDIILESFEEHHFVNVALAEIVKTDVNDERWKAKMTVLKEMVAHHIKEEETVLFPKAKELVSEDELKSIADRMIELKKKLI